MTNSSPWTDLATSITEKQIEEFKDAFGLFDRSVFYCCVAVVSIFWASEIVARDREDNVASFSGVGAIVCLECICRRVDLVFCGHQHPGVGVKNLSKLPTN